MNEATQETAERLAVVVNAVARWLDEQYIQLGKKTIPLFHAVEDAYESLTDEDRAFLQSVRSKKP